MKMRLLSLLLCVVAIGGAVGAQTLRNEWIDYNKTYYKFTIGGFGTDVVNGNAILKKGAVRIPYSTLAAAGMGSIPAEAFQLWRDGEEVPLYITQTSGPLTSTDYIEFWGEVNNGKLDKQMYRDPSLQLSDYWSLQTDTAAYFMTVNNGSNKRFTNQVFDLTGNTRTPEAYFMHTVGRYFRTELMGGFSAVAGQNIYSSSYDMGEGFTSRAVRPNACGSQPQLPQSFTSLAPFLGTAEIPAPEMTININSVGNAPNARTVRVLLNSDSITTYQMDYFYDARVEEYAPVSKISSGNASFILVNQSLGSCDQFRVSSIELTYPRQFDLGNFTSFTLTVPASPIGRYLELRNFNNGGVAPVIYDLANNRRYLGDVAVAGVTRVLLAPSSKPYQLAINSQAGTTYKTITNLQTRNFKNYSLPANQGDYIIISNPLLYGSPGNNPVQDYASYRASTTGGSYNPIVVDVDELVDQFAWGVKKHPLSVKGFLNFARTRFGTAPKFVFIIGRGLTYNAYRNNENNALADRLNLVPTWGSPASDNVLSSSDLTALPLIPIGRLSAVSATEVRNYLQKVKEYDSAQNSNIRTVEGKSWTKNVLQIAGANDLGLGNQLDTYLENYKNIISDTAFGGKVTTFSKNADPANYTNAVLSFKNVYEQGSSLITYFGHSSSTSLDFNLDNPETYNNEFKYPLFIANGCNAGNNFEYESNRLNAAATVSEKFVLAPQRGAIAYLSTTSFGVVNYLNMYTSQFYRAFGKTRYNQPVGIAIQEGIRATLQSTGSPDFFSRVHAEQYALNGDPAIKLNGESLPDYAVGAPQIEINPSFVSVADSNFTVKVKVYNLGRSTRDSVSFRLNRIAPNGEVITLVARKLAPLTSSDSVSVKVPVMGITYKGTNRFEATVDYTGSLAELAEDNNTASREMLISEDEIRPVFPYNNAIVNSTAFKFTASTVNPLSEAKDYLMEVDTTAWFNSPLKKQVTVNSKGGVIEFSPAISFTNNTVYYWRVAPAAAQPQWRVASFKYEQGNLPGFEQSHLYQHQGATYNNQYFDSSSRTFKFGSKTNNLFIVNSIYPTSGVEDAHFSVSVNGDMIIASACDGPVFQFNVFDPITFKPWKNITTNGVGLYGSGPSNCATNRQYNFEFRTIDSANRRKAMQFMDMIPNGAYVVVRSVSSATESVNAYVNTWRADTARYGSGNSIYHRLKAAGFATIDSFYKARTFSFVYKKNDTTFAPRYAMSQGINDRINLDVNCTVPDTIGTVTSPVYGPAKAWKNVKWSGTSSEEGNDIVTMKVIGIDTAGVETTLFVLNPTQQQADISSINPAQYRFVKLQLQTIDAVTATPFQLAYYKVEYDAAPEGGLAPNLYFNIPDSLHYRPARGQGVNDYHLGVAFKNTSKVAFDSLQVKVLLYDEANRTIKMPQSKLKTLAPGDTTNLNIHIDATNLSGFYNLYVQVNPDNAQPEQFSFNNFLYKRVYIQGTTVLPLNLLSFNAQRQQQQVLTTWTTANEANVKHYVVEHSTNNRQFVAVGVVAAANQASGSYRFTHHHPAEGSNYYRLRMADNDGSFTYSQVILLTFANKAVVNVYPNPVKNVLNLSVNLPQGRAATVTLINAFGQQLKQENVAGTAQWNMSAYPAGNYLLRITDGHQVTTHTIQKQ